MFIGIIFGVLVLVVLTLYLIKPKTPKPPDEFHTIGELDDYLNLVVEANHPPALSAAVVKDGEVVYAKGFGLADGPGDVQATKDTVYHWWSMTKIPTAVAVMQLHERGLLNIDDPIKDYLPFFTVTYKGVEQPQISIRQVLNHTAGLSNAAPEIFTWLHMEGDPPLNQTELFMEKFADYDEIAFPPGEKVRYSNFGYMVLGALIETVSGQTYEDYMVQNILDPLGMKNSNFVYSDSMAENEAVGSQHLVDMYTPFIPLLNLGHIIKERTGLRAWFHRVYNDQTPPTGLIGPVTDVARFMAGYLDDENALLRPETAAAINEVSEQLAEPGSSARGLGWEAHLTVDGRRYLTHSGGGPGFATIFRVYPDEKLGVVVMGNDSSIDRELLANILADYDW